MSDPRQYETLLQSIENYTRLIDHAPENSTQRATAITTRDELRAILDRLTAALPARAG